MLFRILSLCSMMLLGTATSLKTQTDSVLLKEVGEKLLNKALNKYWLEVDSVELIFYFPKTDSVIVGVDIKEIDLPTKKILIVFSTGALSLAANEHELASIVGHELGHIDVCLKNLELTGFCLILNVSSISYQDYLEYESRMDRFGLIITKDSGYYPERVVSVLEKRIELLVKQGENDKPFLDFLNCRLLKLKISLNLISSENVSCGSGFQLPSWPTKS